MKKEEWLKKGYVDEPVEKALDLKAEIKRLCREKDAVILATTIRQTKYRK